MNMKLNTGFSMPALGLGCYKASPEEAYCAVRWAIDLGYRHIDTASFYCNEQEVGRAVRDSGVKREELFLVTKLWPTDFARAEQALAESLKKLSAEYVDAYLLHWPGTENKLRCSAWEAVLSASAKGLVRSCGVSNFLPHHMEELIHACGAVPAIDQVELNPWGARKELRAACAKLGIAVTAWGPIFRGKLSEAKPIEEIARRYNKTPAQVTLRWHLQHGISAIPKSVHRDRIRENFDVFDFSLLDTDMAAIDAMDCGKYTGKNPDTYDGRG